MRRTSASAHPSCTELLFRPSKSEGARCEDGGWVGVCVGALGGGGGIEGMGGEGGGEQRSEHMKQRIT